MTNKIKPISALNCYFSDINSYPLLSQEFINEKFSLIKFNTDCLTNYLAWQPKTQTYYVEEWKNAIRSGIRLYKISTLPSGTQLENATISNSINKAMKIASTTSKQNEAYFQIKLCNFNRSIHYNVLDRYSLVCGPEVFKMLYKIKDNITSLSNEIAEANLKLVIKFAKAYNNIGISIEDLIQEGNIGLMRAIEKFDVSKGMKFATYAVWWINQGFLRVIKQNNRLIRIPTHIQEALRRITKNEQIQIKKTGNKPSMAFLAEQEGLTEDELEILYNVCMEPVSLETLVAGEQTKQLKEFIPDTKIDLEKDFDTKCLADSINFALDNYLTSQEKDVIVHRLGLQGHPPHTLEELSAKLNRSREGVRQLETSALNKLKRNASHLEDYHS